MEEMALAFDDIRLLVSLRHKLNLDPVARSLVPSVAQATEMKFLPAPVAKEDRRQFHYLVFWSNKAEPLILQFNWSEDTLARVLKIWANSLTYSPCKTLSVGPAGSRTLAYLYKLGT